MITFSRASSKTDLIQILELQHKNLARNISQGEKEKEGFVTVSHTFDILRTMNDICQHVVAKSEDIVVGYALCMHPKFADEIPILRPMFDELNERHPDIINYMPMGQICIDKAYRGQGIFRELYATMKAALLPRYNLILTEVDAKNNRSLNAHYAIGFRELFTYSASGQDWKVIVLG